MKKYLPLALALTWSLAVAIRFSVKIGETHIHFEKPGLLDLAKRGEKNESDREN